MLDVYLCSCCGGEDGVCRVWLGGLDQGRGVVLCLCELRVRILCVDGWSRYLYILCKADTCASSVHTVFNPVAPYRYWLPTM